jgi:hypothetical protein
VGSNPERGSASWRWLSDRFMTRPFPWFELALTSVFLSATFYAAFSDAYNLPNRWFIRDDAYYYFKVAQNISEGHGSTFDGIHLTNGYHPLWLLVCIPIFALARFDLVLPLRLLAVLTGLLQIATSILLYRVVKRAVSAPAGILAACYWSFSTYVLLFLYKTGVESGLALFFIVLMLHQLQRFAASARELGAEPQTVAGLAAIAVLITLSRLDLVFFAMIVGIWIVFRGSPLRYLLPLDVLAMIVATVAAFLARLGFAPYYDAASSAIFMLTAGLLIKIPVFYLFGLYQPPASWRNVAFPLRLLLGTAVAGVALSLVLIVAGALGWAPSFSRTILLLDSVFAFALTLLVRLAAYSYHLRSIPVDPPSPLALLRSRWKTWLTDSGVYYGILGAALGVYMLWNRLVFGTFTPVSGQVKQWWGSFTHSIYGNAATSWLTFFAANPFGDFNAWAPWTTDLSDWTNRILYEEATGFGNPRWQLNFTWILVACAILVVVLPIFRKRRLVRAVVHGGMLVLFAGSWLQILAYNVPGYASPKEWYWLAEPILLVIFSATLIDLVFEVVVGRWARARFLVWVFVIGYGLHGGLGYWRDAYALSPYGLHPSTTPFTEVIPFLETSTEPGAVIGMTGGGNVGYLMPARTIVNMDGLINSNEYFQALKQGTGADYLYDTGMRYVFANPSLLDANPYRGQFAGRLRLIVDWGGKDLLRLLPPSVP